MANRLTDERVNAIAQAFFKCDMVKSKALQAVGYSYNYSRTLGLKLFDNNRVKAAIARIQAKAAEKAGYTIEQAQAEYEEARVLAEKCNQPAAMVSAITGKARLYGFDKDNAVNAEKTVIVIAPRATRRPVIDAQEADNGV